MNSSELINAIYYLCPTAEFSFNNTDLDSIVWNHPKKDFPTKEEILEAIEPAKAKAQADLDAKATLKAALLNRLGITEDEAKLLLA